MEDQILLERIILNPKVLAGKPVIKGTRLSVEFILGLLAHGSTTAEIFWWIQGVRKRRHAGVPVICRRIA